ncbi:MAG: peptidase [Bacteroidetes bacterium]|jgi:Zn-dependent protease|nr:peptidase [Bacteroidota bacterium]
MDFESMLRLLPGIIVGLTVHEFAHASVASRLGDDTAKSQGRASLNPLVHIDPLGFIFLLVAGFGWAKPVVIDQSKLKHPRRDDAIIAAAGPLSNLALSIVGAAVFTILIGLVPYRGEPTYAWILNALMAGIYVNLGLFVFNAIPLPPLDGSHILLSALNLRDSPTAHLVFRYGMIVLFGIILAEQFFNVDILPIGRMVRALADILLGLFGFSGF